MGKLKEFILENCDWEKYDDNDLDDDDLVTEVVIMYRTVKLTDEDPLPEAFGYFTNKGCSFAMARGIVDCVDDRWVYEGVASIHKDDEDDDE